MAKFIKVRSKLGGNIHLVNVEMVCVVSRGDDDTAILVLAGGIVMDSMEQFESLAKRLGAVE